MVAVITINYNLHKCTIQCVNSILASDYGPLRVGLIDNGSGHDDYSRLKAEFEREKRVRIHRLEKNVGYVNGVNHGIKAASEDHPDYYLVMNNDTIIDSKAITQLVETAKRHENRAIVSGKVYYYDNPDTIQHTGVIFSNKKYYHTFYPGRNETDRGQHDYEAERDSLDDVFWLLPAEVVRVTGLYCNLFFLYAEQGDYAQRARRAGFKLIYTPEAKLWHKESMTIGAGKPQTPAIAYWRAQGRFIFQWRNMKKRFLVPHVIKNFAKYLIKAALGSGERRVSRLAVLRGYFSGLLIVLRNRPNCGNNPYRN